MSKLTDKKHIEQAAAKERRERKQELADLRVIMDLKAGRNFMWRYLGKCGLYKSSFTGNSTTFFNEGMRNIGLQMLADITEADADSYAKMAKENQTIQED